MGTIQRSVTLLSYLFTSPNGSPPSKKSENFEDLYVFVENRQGPQPVQGWPYSAATFRSTPRRFFPDYLRSTVRNERQKK
ncbi:unnamed protein product, partial [Mesorhabditis belari]|uniref:Uncharacterized protein n=1 Tax=Mesorhabditis belari TaxID=2138241 RepID=A0AAF3FR96_9BILA